MDALLLLLLLVFFYQTKGAHRPKTTAFNNFLHLENIGQHLLANSRSPINIPNTQKQLIMKCTLCCD